LQAQSGDSSEETLSWWLITLISLGSLLAFVMLAKTTMGIISKTMRSPSDYTMDERWKQKKTEESSSSSYVERLIPNNDSEYLAEGSDADADADQD
jgi:hypothetical protein